jgi:trans-aconitate 2-methyltransferase
MTPTPTGAFDWDASQYQRYAGERDRPFFDLTARIDAAAPAQVVDLGCGDARLTQSLKQRWPNADVGGIDTSATMLDDARSAGRDHDLRLELGDVVGWRGADLDVIVSNAVLQWVPGHLQLLPGWVAALRPGGWLAFALPGNADSPTHAVMRELAAEEPFASYMQGVRLLQPGCPIADYVRLLLECGCGVDAWETTYQHVLTGADPVVEWVRGTGLRPVLHALPDGVREQFLELYTDRMRRAYPPVETTAAPVTILPFRRLFVVARKANRIDV